MNIKQQLPATVRERMKKMPMPVIYEEACRALVACTTIDEAKYFSNKADALAVWAKIFEDDEAAKAAKCLKLHSYRRIDELAIELIPPKERRGRYWRRHGNAGRPTVLRAAGFKPSQINQIGIVGALSQETFDKVIGGDFIPAPSQLPRIKYSDAWFRWTKSGATQLRAFGRKYPAADFARSFSASEARIARECAVEILEWLDEFDQHLAKDIPQ